jgi:hypothetical protein
MERMSMQQKTVLGIAVLFLVSASLCLGSITLYTPEAGDATYGWNSKYGPYGYGTGGKEMGVGLSMGGSYGNDYTVSIFEIPIYTLAGKTLSSATLEIESLGFGTGYYYGSAAIGWLDTGTMTLTGDVVADGLGPASTGRPGGFSIYNSDFSDTPGTKSFDVLSYIQTDLAAGRRYTTFVLSGSRDTYGSICTAESGAGPRLTVVPEPASLCILGLGGLLLRKRR